MRHKRPPLGCRVKATAYYRRLRARDYQEEPERVYYELIPANIEGVYCGERYLSQRVHWGEAYYPNIRTLLVAVDHKRRVSVRPSDVEVIE